MYIKYIIQLIKYTVYLVNIYAYFFTYENNMLLSLSL